MLRSKLPSATSFIPRTLCSIASPPLLEVATENFNVVAFVKIHKTEKNKDIASP